MASPCGLFTPTAMPWAATACRLRALAAPGWRRRWTSGGGGGGGALPGSSSSLSSSAPPVQPLAARRPTALPAAAREELLKGVDAENTDAVARIVEQAQRAADSWTTGWSDFHSPPVVADALRVLAKMADVSGVAWGGYSQAERCRIAVGREEALAGLADDPAALEGGVLAVQCKGNFMFDAASHRDFLGACLGTGIERSKVGDIIVTGEQGAQLLVAPSMVEHLQVALTQVRTVPVQTTPLSLSELQVRAPRVETLTSVEASLRLDAVASAGFRISRGKMADMVKAGDVRVNWRSGTKPSADVKAGDMISVAGKGRLEISSAERTAKGKFRVEMVRYL